MEQAPGLAPPEGRKDFTPLIVEASLLLIVIAYFSLTVPFFRKKAEAVTLDTNRYIKMEWNLLQELKIQTDRQLREKDLEIAALRAKYREAASGNSSSAALKDLEAKLKEAEAERKELLALPTSAASAPQPAPANAQASAAGGASGPASAPAAAASASLGSPALDVLLLARIDEQEARMAELTARNAEAERELVALKAGAAPLAAPRAEDLAAAYSRALGGALESLKAGKAEAERAGSVGIDDLNAWALLKALANTPSIKEKYPDLLPAVEKYVTAYGDRRFSEGRGEAYAESIKALEALARGLGK